METTTTRGLREVAQATRNPIKATWDIRRKKATLTMLIRGCHTIIHALMTLIHRGNQPLGDSITTTIKSTMEVTQDTTIMAITWE